MFEPGDWRLATGGLLALLIFVGSLALWIGVPVAGLWAAGQITASPPVFLMIVLLAVPLAMAAGAIGLHFLDVLYLRLRPRSRPLLPVAMPLSVGVAVVVGLVWFFLFAEMRLAPMP